MKPLSPQARRLFDLSRDETGPDVQVRVRIARALAARIATGAGAAAVGSSGAAVAGLAPVASKAVLLTTLTKSVLLVSAGVLATAGWLTLRPSHRGTAREDDRSEVRTGEDRTVARASVVDKTALVQPAAAPPADVAGPPSLRREISPSPSPSPSPRLSSRATLRAMALQKQDVPLARVRAAESTDRPSPDQNPRAFLDPQGLHPSPDWGPGTARPWTAHSPQDEALPAAAVGAIASARASQDARAFTPPDPEVPQTSAHIEILPSAPSTTARSTRATPAAASVHMSSQPEDLLQAETNALRTAQQALRGGKPRQALELLDAQDASFANGELKQERLAARVLALCQSGLVAEARAQAVRFGQLWPRSALMSRVRSACWESTP